MPLGAKKSVQRTISGDSQPETANCSKLCFLPPPANPGPPREPSERHRSSPDSEQARSQRIRRQSEPRG
eukprot:11022157-Alexandrium_andersonii.AAC.1